MTIAASGYITAWESFYNNIIDWFIDWLAHTVDLLYTTIIRNKTETNLHTKWHIQHGHIDAFEHIYFIGSRTKEYNKLVETILQ